MTKVLCRKSEVSHQAYIQKCGCDDILVEWEFKLVEISTISFDTNSNHIGIDNHCLACISHIQNDFKGELVQGSQPIEGFGSGRTFNIWLGTIQSKIEDDDGKGCCM